MTATDRVLDLTRPARVVRHPGRPVPAARPLTQPIAQRLWDAAIEYIRALDSARQAERYGYLTDAHRKRVQQAERALDNWLATCRRNGRAA